METHSFHRVSGDSSKLCGNCVSTNFPHQKIRLNLDILRSDLPVSKLCGNNLNREMSLLTAGLFKYV